MADNMTVIIIKMQNKGYFDWDDYRYDDWQRPTEKRYSWKGEMGHLILDEFNDDK